MASRLYVFWMSLFVIAAVKDYFVLCVVFFLIALNTTDPGAELRNTIYQDTKRIVIQSFEHFVNGEK